MRELIKITIDGSTEDGAIASVETNGTGAELIGGLCTLIKSICDDANISTIFLLELLNRILTDPDSFSEHGIAVTDIDVGIPQ